MKKKISLILRLTGILITLSYLPLSLAQPINPDKGFYLGVEGGYSKANYQPSTLTGGFTARTVDRSGPAIRVAFGYDFKRYICAELSVVYLHKPIYKDVSASPPFDQVIKNNFVVLMAKGSYPITDHFDLNARLGIGYVVRNGIKVNKVVALIEDEIFRPMYGLGMVYHIRPQWHLSATWIQAPRKQSKQLPTSNYIGIGVYYKFVS